MNQDLVTGAEAADLPTRKIKAAMCRFILLEQFSNSPLVDQIHWDDVIPLETDSVFYSPMNAQIAFVRELSASLRHIGTITSIFEISNSTYYAMFPLHNDLEAAPFSPLHDTRGGSPSLMPAELGAAQLTHIEECQNRCDCPSPRECREWLSQQLSTESHKLVVDRYWWKRFEARHEKLSVRRYNSREVARASIRRNYIVPYIDALAEMLSRPFYPDLVINMDE
jgi:hypothetical protein